jgi:uncharacterized protein YdhG (YjbR/CyaY superfamily)
MRNRLENSTFVILPPFLFDVKIEWIKLVIIQKFKGKEILMTQSISTTKKSKGFTAEEKAAMKAHAKELKAAERAKQDRAAGESDVLAAIAEMQEPDRSMAERIHAIIKASAPDLWPRTWYGMPAYARDGNIICHFQTAQKFKMRYATLGFSDKANLDDGDMWPVAYALKDLTPAEEAKITALVKKAVS